MFKWVQKRQNFLRAALTLSGRELHHSRKYLAGRRQRLFLTTCSDGSKPYMILVALVKGFQNHIGFATIRATGEEWQARERSEAPV